jgi:signal peptidase I
MIINVFKVTEQSLTPDFIEGDFVITFKIPRFLGHYKKGDVVIFDQSPYGRLIKRVQSVSSEDHSLFVIGTHPNSIDSREFGMIRDQSVLGKVVWHIHKKASP